MTIIFGILIIEMVLLSILVLPLPYPVRKKGIDLYGRLRQLSNFNIGVLFGLILLGTQFFDCLTKVFKHENGPYFTFQSQPNNSLKYDQLASMFYAQRNLYITGAVLYLFLSIYTVTTILRKLVQKETDFRNFSSQKGSTEDTEAYKKAIKEKEIDIDAMVKQIKGLQRSYDELNASKEIEKDD